MSFVCTCSFNSWSTFSHLLSKTPFMYLYISLSCHLLSGEQGERDKETPMEVDQAPTDQPTVDAGNCIIKQILLTYTVN